MFSSFILEVKRFYKNGIINVCVCVFLRALEMLIPVTSKVEVSDSGMSPLHSAAAGGHTKCLKVCVFLLSLTCFVSRHFGSCPVI